MSEVYYDDGMSSGYRCEIYRREHLSESPIGQYDTRKSKAQGMYGHYLKHRDRYTKKSKYVEFILYPDNPHHMYFLNYLRFSGHIDYAFILHEPDKNNELVEEEERITDNQANLKPHYHVVLAYSYSKPWGTFLSDLYRFGILACYPVGVLHSDIDECLLYFVHRSAKAILDKKPPFQFDDLVYSGVFIQLVNRLQIREQTRNLATPHMLLLDYVYNCTSIEDFLRFSFSNDELYKVFKSNQLTFWNLLQIRFNYKKDFKKEF